MAELSPDQAKKLLAAEEDVAQARVALQEAEKERARLRGRYRPKLALGRAVEAGGVEVTVKEVGKAASFRIAGYLGRHKITKAMQPFFTAASTREDWTVKRLPGKKKRGR